MPETVSIKFYDITHCGYYDNKLDTHKFGSCEEALSDLTRWVKPKSVGETCTYDTKNSDDQCGVYCLDISGPNHSQDFIVAMWNQTLLSDGKVASVKRSCKLGEAKASLAKFSIDDIPGFATYFLFIPSENALATLSFKSRPNGLRQLHKYLDGFLCTLSSRAITQKNLFSESRISGYRADNYDFSPLVYPKFKCTPMKNDGKIQHVIDKQSLISSIHRNSKFLSFKKIIKNYLMRNLIGLRILGERIVTQELDTKLKINYTPSLDELNGIINYWEENYREAWDDVGFKFSDNKSIYWLGKSLVATSLDLNINIKPGDIIDAKSLLKAVTDNRSDILKVIEQ